MLNTNMTQRVYIYIAHHGQYDQQQVYVVVSIYLNHFYERCRHHRL